MFYLRSIFNIFKLNTALLLFHSVFFLSFIIGLNFQKNIHNFFGANNKPTEESYISALVKGKKDLAFLKLKLENLPGVKKVFLQEKVDANKELSATISDIDFESILGVGLYQPVKILLEANISSSSKNLIQEYLARLIGQDDVTFSRVKKNNVAGFFNHPYYLFFSKWAEHYVSIILFTLWLFTLILLIPQIHQQAYIIESFQRRKFVAIKLYFTFLLMLVIVSSSVIILNFQLNLLSTLYFLLIPIISFLLLSSSKNLKFRKNRIV